MADTPISTLAPLNAPYQATDALYTQRGGVLFLGLVSDLYNYLKGLFDALYLPIANGLQWTNAGFGIAAGQGLGGTVTQSGSRSTGVTLNKLCGQITTNNASLAAGAEAAFTLTNSTIGANDVVVACIKSKATGTPSATVTAVAAGSCEITVTNLHASTADTTADVISFMVIKGSSN